MSANRPVGLLEVVVNNRNFRLLWLAQLISQLGDWFNVVATATLVGYLTGSAAAIGVLFAVRLAAPVFVSPLAGVCADLMNRKHILIASDIARALTMLGFLLIRTPDDIWLVYTLTAIQLGLSGLFYPTREAILPDLARGGELVAANVLGMASWSVMVSVGTAIGGVIAGVWGPAPAFMIDAMTFVISALLLAQIRYAPVLRAEHARPSVRSAIAQYGHSLAYLRANPAIFIAVLHNVFIAAFAATTSDIFAAGIARDVFVYGAGGSISLGIMLACSGLASGMAPGSFLRTFGGTFARKHHAIIAGYAIIAIGAFVVAPLASFATALAGIALRGTGSSLVWVFSTQLLLEQVPEHLRGRVFATHFAMFQLAGASAALGVGHALDALGYSAVMDALGGVVLVPGVAFTVWYLARGRRPVAVAVEQPADS
ncbi:MAG TPA: MFS transporter [Kofleriaceae bacterium]